MPATVPDPVTDSVKQDENGHVSEDALRIRGGLPLRGRMRRLFVEDEGDAIVSAAPLLSLPGIWRWVWPYLRPVRRWLALSVVLILMVPLIEAARLYMLKVMVDEVLVPSDLGPFVWIAGVILGFTLLYGVTSYFATYVAAWIGQRFILSMTTDFFRHLQGLSLDFFERHRLGDILARLVADVRSIETVVLSGINNVLVAVFKIVIFGSLLFFIDWQLALVVLAVAPGFWLVMRWLTRLVKRATRERSRRGGSLTALAEESISNIALVQAYNRQEFEIERFHRENQGAVQASLVTWRLKALVTPLIDGVQGVAALTVLALGTLALRDGDLTVGGLLVFIAYVTQLFSPVRQLATQYNLIAGATAGAERVIEFFNYRPTVVDAPDAVPLPPASGAVEFDSVTFRYPGTRTNAVEGVSLHVAPGETVALVGDSGAGKTSLTKLLLRFYDVQGGAIRLDGKDVREVQLSSLRDNIAVLMQEAFVFEGTISENIRYGRPDASDEAVVRAAKAADAHEFISSLPEGYNTLVGQKGRRLSGGQRQRIAIARAMIRDAPILVLDEPTTGLDMGSGERIMRPLENLMSGRTTIVISHNLVTAGRADRIVVMKKGTIVEMGSPAELAAQGGEFSRLRRLHEAGMAAISGL
jgi:ABC-type multidrug transport system fused ATPase/permease subunit